jgi:hypothetical protein
MASGSTPPVPPPPKEPPFKRRRADEGTVVARDESKPPGFKQFARMKSNPSQFGYPDEYLALKTKGPIRTEREQVKQLDRAGARQSLQRSTKRRGRAARR